MVDGGCTGYRQRKHREHRKHRKQRKPCTGCYKMLDVFINNDLMAISISRCGFSHGFEKYRNQHIYLSLSSC